MDKIKSRQSDRTGEGSALFYILCNTQSTSSLPVASASYSVGETILLDHHHFNSLNDTWIRSPSKPQPYIKINASVHQEDYHSLGYTLTSPTQTTEISVMADTSCQSCLASLTIIRRLGLARSDLLSVTMQMHTASNGRIKILGAAIIRLQGKRHDSSDTKETRQIVHQ